MSQNLGPIKSRAAAMRPDLPLHSVLEYLAQHWEGPSTEYAVYSILIAIKQLGMQELFTALWLLDGEPLYVLDHRWTIEGQSGRLYINDDDVKEALGHNRYQHLATGELIVEARHKVELCYHSGPALDDLMLKSQGFLGSSAA